MSEAHLVCVSCRKELKAGKSFGCGVCEASVCKNCLEVLPEGRVPFMQKVPPELTHRNYCQGCYSEHVQPALDRYDQCMEAAEGVFVFFKSQKAQIPLIKKELVVMRVKDFTDRDQAILCLAFWAAEQGHNAILQVEAIGSKVRNEGFQKMAWSAEGVAATVNASKVDAY